MCRRLALLRRPAVWRWVNQCMSWGRLVIATVASRAVCVFRYQVTARQAAVRWAERGSLKRLSLSCYSEQHRPTRRFEPKHSCSKLATTLCTLSLENNRPDLGLAGDRVYDCLWAGTTGHMTSAELCPSIMSSTNLSFSLFRCFVLTLDHFINECLYRSIDVRSYTEVLFG